MVYRLVRNLLNNEKVIQELSESAPIRGAARLIVRSAATVGEKISNVKIGSRLQKISQIYKEEYKKAIDKK